MELISRFVAFLLLLILSPGILFISILSLIFQGNPVFYKQERVGFKCKNFKIHKFRTMINNTGDSITKYNDSRITLFGKILRKTKIDEIPQLFNILKGEMRFIGPRPEVPKYFKKNQFIFLNLIKPGLSDFSSIIFRNEDQILKKIGGDKPYEKLLPLKISLAHYYSKKKSFILDFMLVAITIISIFMPNYSSKKLLIPILSKDMPEIKSFFNKYTN